MKVLTCKETRELEERAVALGASYYTLMENAGSAVAGFIRSECDYKNSDIVILCGKGNNGGDGFVVAEKLCSICGSMTVILVAGAPATALALKRFEQMDTADVKILRLEASEEDCMTAVRRADVIVDAIYGIGFHGEFPPELSALAAEVNDSRAAKIAVDIPSGLNGDSNRADGTHIMADATITFSTYKPVHLYAPSKYSCGRVELCQVGIGKNCIQEQKCSMYITDDAIVRKALPKRSSEGNKGTFGRAMLVCGSKGMAGAAVMSLNAAVRSGVGLVEGVLPEDIYSIAASNALEPVYTLYGDDISDAVNAVKGSLQRAKACLVGCGLGTSERAKAVVRTVLEEALVPVVLDADALNIIAEDISLLNTADAPVIVTPHPGEMARLIGRSVREIESDRLFWAKKLAADYGITVVLKGHHTIIAGRNGEVAFNATGNSGMAKGGSGDVLAGLIVGLCAQGMRTFEAAATAVHIHGKAGDAAAEEMSVRGMTPTDIIRKLPEVFKIYE